MKNYYCYLTARKRGAGTEILTNPVPYVFKIDNLGLNEATAQWQVFYNPRKRQLKNIAVNPKELVLYCEGEPDGRILLNDYLSFRVIHTSYGYSAGYVIAIECDRMSSRIYTKYTVYLPMPYFLPTVENEWGVVTEEDFFTLNQYELYNNPLSPTIKDNYYIYGIAQFSLFSRYPTIIRPHSYKFTFKNSAGESEKVQGYFKFYFNNEKSFLVYPSYNGTLFESFVLKVLDTGVTIVVNDEIIEDAERDFLPYFQYLQQYNYYLYFYALKETSIEIRVEYNERKFI